jgi:hypothetical protein
MPARRSTRRSRLKAPEPPTTLAAAFGVRVVELPGGHVAPVVEIDRFWTRCARSRTDAFRPPRVIPEPGNSANTRDFPHRGFNSVNPRYHGGVFLHASG